MLAGERTIEGKFRRAYGREKSALLERAEQGRVVARIVLQIGILNQKHIPARGGKTAPQRRPLAPVALVAEHGQAAAAGARGDAWMLDARAPRSIPRWPRPR